MVDSTAEEYRRTAAALRLMAETAQHEETGEELRLLAVRFEKLAERVEARENPTNAAN